MGLADRLRDAARPANTIAHDGPAPPRVEPVPPAAVPPRPPRGEKPPASATEPEGVARAYYVEDRGGGARRYYDDYRRTAEAMRATDRAVSTRREDLNTVRAMLDIAASRGWSDLRVSGSENFRREVWIEARARGVEVRGHTPTDPDRQEAERRAAERRPAANEVRATPPGEAGRDGGRPPSGPPANGGRAESAKGDTARSATPPPPKDAAAVAARPSPADHAKAYRAARAELSPDGRLVLGALAEKIDRQMDRLNREAKAELKASVAVQLAAKERREGPVVLSAEQRRAAAAPEPEPERGREAAATAPVPPPPPRRAEPEAPRRSLGR